MNWKTGRQVIKTRDDHTIVVMDRVDSPVEPTFRVPEGTSCPWLPDKDSVITQKTLRKRIEPWLTALLQSEHFSLLIGSGLTHAVNAISENPQLHGMQTTQFGIFDTEISETAEASAVRAGRDSANFEDQLRVANELLLGLEVLPPPETPEGVSSHSQVMSLRKGIVRALEGFTASLLEGERNLVSTDPANRERAFNYLVSFLMTFASRTGTRERLHVFTTNYDRYIEAGADVAGLRLVDRFVGTLAPVFRASRLDVDLHYNPPGIRGEPRYLEGVARFTKLHGSIDWVDSDGAIRRMGMPFGARDSAPYLAESGTRDVDPSCLMIYPNSAKDRETAYYPYVELFRDFAAALCRPNSTLVCYGYAFGDDHINRVIADMLTIPSTHLVIISYDDRLGRIMRFFDNQGRHAQVTLMLGDHVGDLPTLVDRYLPKAAIDRTTFRMAELLRARWSTDTSERDDSGGESAEAGDLAE